jgi:RNA polymerase sigma-70 factor (ECF subfamily)
MELNLAEYNTFQSTEKIHQSSIDRTADFAEKYELYSNMVYKICLVRLGSKENAEDAMQNVFIKLYSKAPSFNNQNEEKAWLIRVAVNACKDFQKSFWQKNTIGLDEISEISDGGIKDRQKLIDIFNLPPKYRTVLQLYYYEGYSEKEIARILKIAEKSVAMQLYRARKKLKKEMEAAEYEK